MTAVAPARSPGAQRIWTVIVNWRQPAATLACLASLERAGADLGDVVVIDNESRDDLLIQARRAFPRATVLTQSENLGFARAVNIGAKYAIEHGATAVLLLNNDAVLLPDAMRNFADALARDSRLGVVTAKVFLTEAPDRLWAVGGHFTGRRVDNVGAGEKDVGAYDDVQLDFVYGCAMLVRADVFRTLGGLDERFFLYYEDIDFCLRARDAGWEVRMAPDAHALHEGSKSTRGEPSLKVYHHARSRMLFFRQHIRAQRVAFAVSELAFIARHVATHLVRGEGQNALAYIRGTLDALQ
jgi:GT2 family glycosyltransferase